MLGNALRLIRVFHDMKSSDLAKKLGISPAYLSKIEKEKASPSIELLQKYAQIFETTTASLLFFADNLDEDKKRGVVKKSIRNIMIKFLEAMDEIKNENSKDL